MESRNNILKELQELSPALASSYPLPVPYKVPEGYFGTLPAAILSATQPVADNAADELQELSPLLRGISKSPPFHLPEGYFSSLPENTVAETKALAFVQEELDDFSPVLHNLKNASLYEVPSGYFDQLPNAILQKVQGRQTAKVVKMGVRQNLRRYIAAAAVLLVLATGAWWYFQPATNISQPVADIKQVPDEELVNFLDNQSLATLENSTAIASNIEFNGEAMKDLLTDVSDEELQQYIDKNSSLLKTITN